MLPPPLVIKTAYHTKISLRKSQQFSKQSERKQLMLPAPEVWHLVWKGGLDLLTRLDTGDKGNFEVDNWSDTQPGWLTDSKEDTSIKYLTYLIIYFQSYLLWQLVVFVKKNKKTKEKQRNFKPYCSIPHYHESPVWHLLESSSMLVCVHYCSNI